MFRCEKMWLRRIISQKHPLLGPQSATSLYDIGGVFSWPTLVRLAFLMIRVFLGGYAAQKHASIGLGGPRPRDRLFTPDRRLRVGPVKLAAAFCFYTLKIHPII
jgi:hypothetical protein